MRLSVVLFVSVVVCSCEPEREHVRSVKADDLAAAYRANEVRSDALWRGKLAQVSGTVSGIGKVPIYDTPYVSLGSGFLASVSCDLRDDSQALNIHKGGWATYVCRIDGYSFGSVHGTDCIYVAPRRR